MVSHEKSFLSTLFTSYIYEYMNKYMYIYAHIHIMAEQYLFIHFWTICIYSSLVSHIRVHIDVIILVLLVRHTHIMADIRVPQSLLSFTGNPLKIY